MKRLAFIILFSIVFTSCELIVIGTKADTNLTEIIEYNQKSALGTIYLFKAELDSNNVPAASQMLKKPDGDTYLAIERYERFYDIHRYRRMISSREITDISSVVLSPDRMRYNLEFDFRRKLYFTALKIENIWFITEMGNHE
jgi:hypothetical protein